VTRSDCCFCFPIKWWAACVVAVCRSQQAASAVPASAGGEQGSVTTRTCEVDWRGSDAQCQPFAANARALRPRAGISLAAGYPVLFHFPLHSVERLMPSRMLRPSGRPRVIALLATDRRKDLRGWNGRCLRNIAGQLLRRVGSNPLRHRSSWCRPAGPTSICQAGAAFARELDPGVEIFLLGFPTRGRSPYRARARV